MTDNMVIREVRAPMAATVTSAYTSPGTSQLPDWNTEDAINYQYYANIVVFASIQAIAQDVAQLAFRAGADPDKPDNYSTGAPLAKLLGPEPGSPNEEMSTTTFWEFTIAQLYLSGCFAWEVEYGKGSNQIFQLWPLMSRFVRPIVSQDPKYYFSGIEYRVGNKAARFDRQKALYHWRPAPENARQPLSKLKALQLSSGVMVMQDRYDYAFLRNDARPAAVIIHEAFATKLERDAWREDYVSKHGGPDNAGKIHWIEASEDGAAPKDAFHIEQLGLTQVDAEFIKRYDQKLRDIVMGMGVPMSRLGDTSARTYSNADKEYDIYLKNIIAPVARELASFVNRRLAPRVGTEVGWFDLRPYEVEARNNKIIKAGIPELVKTRVLKFNEARGALALPPVEGGDRFMTDEELGMLQNGGAAMLSASRLVLTQKDPANLKIDPQTQLPEDAQAIKDEQAAQQQQQLEGQLALAAAKPTTPSKPAAQPAPSAGARGRAVRAAAHARKPVRKSTYRTIDARATVMETEFAGAFRSLLQRQKKIVMERLNGKRGRKYLSEFRDGADIGGLFDRDFWKMETRAVFLTLYTKIFQDALARINEKYGVEIGAELAGEAYAVQRAARMADAVTATTYDAIEKSMRAGATDGEPIADLEARIAHIFDSAYASRPDTVARTEVMSAFNGSNALIAHAASPMFSAQEWIATPDMRTRETHADADGQVQPVGAAFSVGEAQLMYPGDPDGPAEEVINCRCALDLLTENEEQAYKDDATKLMTDYFGTVTDLLRGVPSGSVQ